ncbi:MAG: hypothetical protein R3Y63_10515 [Eubacteriales bacterium]
MLYSIFYYVGDDLPLKENLLNEISAHYLSGTKIFGIFSTEIQISDLINHLDLVLAQKNLKRQGKYLAPLSHEEEHESPKIEEYFFMFHGSFHLAFQTKEISSFTIENGTITDFMGEMEMLHQCSSFDLPQFQAEHALIKQNLFIEGGAGSGKTKILLDRLLFLCHEKENFWDSAEILFFSLQTKNYFLHLFKKQIESYSYLHENQDLNMPNSENLPCYLLEEFIFHQLEEKNLTMTEDFSLLKEIIANKSEEFFLKNQEEYEKSNHYLFPLKEIETCLFHLVLEVYHKNISPEKLRNTTLGELEEPYGLVKKFLHNSLLEVVSLWENTLVMQGLIHQCQIIPLFLKQTSPPIKVEKILFVDGIENATEIEFESILAWAKERNTTFFISKNRQNQEQSKKEIYQEVTDSPQEHLWKFFSFVQNYRCDRELCGILSYHSGENTPFFFEKRCAFGNSNFYLKDYPEKFFHSVEITREQQRFSAIYQEIQRTNNRIQYEKEKNISSFEHTIAILVENIPQVERICEYFGERGIEIISCENFSCAQSDLKKLIEGLIFSNLTLPLFRFANSHFFAINIPNSHLLLQNKGNSSGIDFLTEKIQQQFAFLSKDSYFLNWEDFQEKIFAPSPLTTLKQFYLLTKPWDKVSGETEENYKKNLDDIFDQLKNKETISEIYDFLLENPDFQKKEGDLFSGENINQIFCLTPEQGSGLEFSHVILPYPIKMESSLISSDSLHTNWGTPSLSCLFSQNKVQESSQLPLKFFFQCASKAKSSFSWIHLNHGLEKSFQDLVRKDGKNAI